MAAPGILDCGHAPTPTSGSGTGYATDSTTGETKCYACADQYEIDLLRTADRFVAYLSLDSKRITTWTGGTLGTVTRATDSAPAKKTYVRVTDVHGIDWYGVGPIESGTYVSLRRVKDQRNG